jgi:hypothetical protein
MDDVSEGINENDFDSPQRIKSLYNDNQPNDNIVNSVLANLKRSSEESKENLKSSKQSSNKKSLYTIKESLNERSMSSDHLAPQKTPFADQTMRKVIQQLNIIYRESGSAQDLLRKSATYIKSQQFTCSILRILMKDLLDLAMMENNTFK